MPNKHSTASGRTRFTFVLYRFPNRGTSLVLFSPFDRTDFLCDGACTRGHVVASRGGPSNSRARRARISQWREPSCARTFEVTSDEFSVSDDCSFYLSAKASPFDFDPHRSPRRSELCVNCKTRDVNDDWHDMQLTKTDHLCSRRGHVVDENAHCICILGEVGLEKKSRHMTSYTQGGPRLPAWSRNQKSIFEFVF